MNVVFNHVAGEYDQDFTNSAIGRYQRNQVRKQLIKSISPDVNLNILELNCGTGEDAQWFAEKGHTILATDVSEEMLRVAELKNKYTSVRFQKVDLNEINSNVLTEKYDLIFSNFGGLNCIDESNLTKLVKQLSDQLKENGKFIAVVMPRFCSWETFYFILKGSFSNAFRRRKPYVFAKVGDKEIKTWYYSIRNMDDIASPYFKREVATPIGLFVPPSYLNNFFSKHVGILKMLARLDEYFKNFTWLANFSDHSYIQYRLK